MPNFERVPPKGPQFQYLFAITVTAFGSAYIAYNYVASKQYYGVLEKFGLLPIISDPPSTRMKILLSCIVINYFRKLYWIFQLRNLEMKASETGAIYLFSLFMDICVLTFAARNTAPSPNLTDTIATSLYAIGSIFETGHDYLRTVWKQDPANAGKPYMEGFAKFVVHPNYFGYLLVRSGICLISGNPYITAIFPSLMAADLIISAIPGLQQHNKKKYGKPYEDYLAKTWNLIPFLW